MSKTHSIIATFTETPLYWNFKEEKFTAENNEIDSDISNVINDSIKNRVIEAAKNTQGFTGLVWMETWDLTDGSVEEITLYSSSEIQ